MFYFTCDRSFSHLGAAALAFRATRGNNWFVILALYSLYRPMYVQSKNYNNPNRDSIRSDWNATILHTKHITYSQSAVFRRRLHVTPFRFCQFSQLISSSHLPSRSSQDPSAHTFVVNGDFQGSASAETRPLPALRSTNERRRCAQGSRPRKKFIVGADSTTITYI